MVKWLIPVKARAKGINQRQTPEKQGNASKWLNG
jgi:hypothetical protein